MNLLDLIQTNPDEAAANIAAMLNANAMAFLDSYEPVDEEQLDELSGATTRSYRAKRLAQFPKDGTQPHPAGDKVSAGLLRAWNSEQRKEEPVKMDPQSWGDRHGGKY